MYSPWRIQKRKSRSTNYCITHNGSGRQGAAKRRRGNTVANHRLFSNGSLLEPLESKMVIGHRVAASPLCRVLSARAIRHKKINQSNFFISFFSVK